IELYDDATLVKTESAPPAAPPIFSAIIPWTPAELGNQTLRVIAYDTTSRASAPDEIVVSVTPDTRRPTAVIIYPQGTPQVDLGSVLQIQAAAVDEVGVTQLDLLVDNQVYTYVTSPNASGQSPFPTVFSWIALTPGTHTLALRAHDNQDQTNDSSPLKVIVVDNHTPALSLALDRTNALANDPITITITALDVSGIQRVELWVNKETASVTTSSSPARQTLLTTQTVWQATTPGEYQVSARAYNANGNVKESPPQTISILRPGQPTPTRAPTPTATRARAPRATATPRLQPPAPPTAELLSPNDKFVAPAPLRVTFGGKGNAELDHIELWGYYQDQPMPQLLCAVDARATTQKNAQCDWTLPDAGMVYLFAQAIDSYHQSGRSPTISGFIGVPPLASPTPTPVALSGRWVAPGYTATLRQTGSTLRGEFRQTIPGADIDGRITAGTIKSDRVTFHVDFLPPNVPTATSTPGAETPTPAATPTLLTPTAVTPLAPALDFDCSVDAAVVTLTCTWKDARGRSGTAVFRRESSAP
ncbi:MAG: hypothetical protein KGJ80_11505, partial [Chloroflexota bacterium]|nr:hypothetical protein [Chloroflexota bacterium]